MKRLSFLLVLICVFIVLFQMVAIAFEEGAQGHCYVWTTDGDEDTVAINNACWCGSKYYGRDGYGYWIWSCMTGGGGGGDR